MAFNGRKREIKQVDFDELLKDVCHCCYITCKCLRKCRSKYRNNIPVFWTFVWMLNATPWVMYTSQTILTSLSSSKYIQVTAILTSIFSTLSFVNAVIVICVHPGPIETTSTDEKPMPPIHCKTNSDNDLESLKDNEDNRFCKICNIYKPRRAHHCSQCGICIDRMDHHCLWLNQCIGFNNHRNFIQFLNYYTCLTVVMIPYVFIVFGVMIYRIFINFVLLSDMEWMTMFVLNAVLLSAGIFILFMMIQLLRRQYHLLSNDITFIEYVYDKRQTHGQYSKGSKCDNLKLYLCRPNILYFFLPIRSANSNLS